MGTNKTAKVKAAAADFPVPQTLMTVNLDIARIGRLQRQRQRIAADMNDAVAMLKAQHEAKAAPLKAQIEALAKGVQTFCEAHRGELTGGRRKFHRFAAGEVQWRMRPPRVTVRNIKLVLGRLKKHGLLRFIRVREEIDKEAMLKESAVAARVQGVKLEQGEDFVIRPFETELEEVAK